MVWVLALYLIVSASPEPMLYGLHKDQFASKAACEKVLKEVDVELKKDEANMRASGVDGYLLKCEEKKV